MSDPFEQTGRTAPLIRRERTGLLAFAVPNLDEPYFAELTTLLVGRAGRQGIAILIQQTDGDHEREIDVANGVGLPPTDGLIHIPRSLTVGDLTRRTSPGPLVLLGEHIQVSPFTHVTIDNAKATSAATRHLFDAGCTRIAYIGPRNARPSDAADRRYTGYVEALTELGLEHRRELVVPVDAFTPDEGFHRTERLISSAARFDGIVCSNDSVAMGALAACAAAGITVPDDVAVIGIDNVRASQFTVPSLTSVAPDDEALVDSALTEIERQIATPPGANLPVRHISVDTRIAARASTRRPRS